MAQKGSAPLSPLHPLHRTRMTFDMNPHQDDAAPYFPACVRFGEREIPSASIHSGHHNQGPSQRCRIAQPKDHNLARPL